MTKKEVKKEEVAKEGGSFLDETIPPLTEMVAPPLPEENEEEQEQEQEEEEKQSKIDLSTKKPQPPADLKNVRPKSVRRTVNVDPDLPQATIIDRDGHTERKKRAVSLNLSEKILPPLTRGRAAVYRWLDKVVIDPVTKEVPDPRDANLPGTYMLYDRFEMNITDKMKLQRNLGRPQMGRDPVTGKQSVQDTVEDIEFTAGLCRVIPEQNYRKYVFMELHPLNKSNPFAPRGVEYLFERVDIVNNKSDAFIAAAHDLAYQAEKTVVEITDRDLIIGYATSAGLTTFGVPTERIKTDLRMWARQKPRDFFALNNNTVVPVRLNLIDATQLGIIVYEHDRNRFVDPESNKEIFVHSIGKDPMEDFVEAMVKKENQHIYKYIVDMLNYWTPDNPI